MSESKKMAVFVDENFASAKIANDDGKKGRLVFVDENDFDPSLMTASYYCPQYRCHTNGSALQ
jgi:hypothetical protein